MPELTSVFISHSHQDGVLAAAFGACLKDIFGGVNVHFSSDKEAGAGPQGGHNWLQWIHERMLECQEALLLLTPYSIQKPWPMWESGAVAGIALSAPAQQGAVRDKSVTPIRFKLPPESLPGPFVVTQSFDGTDEGQLKKLLKDLMRRYNYSKNNDSFLESAMRGPLSELRTQISAWMKIAPALVTEGTISEWCARLDRLHDTKQRANVVHLHRWIRLMYEGPLTESDGQTGSNAPMRSLWDVRLHLRLGEHYAACNLMKEAIQQYELATELAPLDVFVMYRLAKSYLDSGDTDGARKTIDRILALDREALKWNVEVAGLEGRLWKDAALKAEQENKPAQARDHRLRARAAYQAALDGSGNGSYYLADNVGQLSLLLDDQEGARKAYEIAERALESVTSGNQNFWSLATRATAALVLNKSEDEVLTHLRGIALDPAAGEEDRRSIRKGLEAVQKGLKRSPDDYRRWIKALEI